VISAAEAACAVPPAAEKKGELVAKGILRRRELRLGISNEPPIEVRNHIR
jgi:hypothetical protein